MDRGDRFGDYVIIKHLASGGMAKVYLARQTGVGGFTKAVAMKVILPQFAGNKEFINMFLDEARLCVYLNHAHIAQVLDLGEVNGQYYIAMEFAHGEDLQMISRMTRKRGRLLPLPSAAKIVSQIAEGLYYAHTKTDDQGKPLGVIHRDISPHNIILTFDGQAKLIDFGIAKATVTYKEEEEGVLKGKFSYMSPEQIRGMPLDSRSDIFALGIVLWEICTGASLYRESSELLTMEAILRKPVPKPRELRGDMPPELESIILKSLAKRTVDRFQTAVEMHQALEDYLNSSGWNVGTPHLSEFMRKLFPDDFTSIRDLIEEERQIAESENLQGGSEKDFVAWEPYDPAERATPAQMPVATDPDPAVSTSPGMPALQPGQAQVTVHSPSTNRLPPAVPTSPGPASRATKPWMMIAIIVLLLSLVVLGLGILLVLYSDDGANKPAEKQQPITGSLHLDSKPPGAQVSVNGKPHGETPLDIADLALGEELTIKFELDGYEKYFVPVRLSPQRHSATIKADLKQF